MLASLSALTALAGHPCRTAECRQSSLAGIDYSRYFHPLSSRTPPADSFFMNFAGAGHIELAGKWSAAVGLGAPVRGTGLAQAAAAADKPFVYLTLTNDHLRPTEAQHDLTVAWDRARPADGERRRGRIIGPAGLYKDEATRKKSFCYWSEELARAHSDRSLRFSLPCAAGERVFQRYVPDYEALLASEKAAALAEVAVRPEPLWIVRTLRGKNRVIAFGGGIQPKVLRQDQVQPERLQVGKSLLLRFLDPPLLQRGTHLGVPVATRFELRVFGLAQWQPLRLWVSRHGFMRGGSPWWNYSTAAGLGASNRLMWELSAAPDPSCDPLPNVGTPWLSSERYDKCKGKAHPSRANPRAKDPKNAQPAGCCICQTVGDTIDTEHGERGFATTGTLRKLRHIAAQNGLQVDDL